jgi:hypothetical protein
MVLVSPDLAMRIKKLFEHPSTIFGYLFELDVRFGIFLFFYFNIRQSIAPKKNSITTFLKRKKNKITNCQKFTQKTIGLMTLSLSDYYL